MRRDAPASTPAANGTASVARHSSSVSVVDGIAWWESPGAAPCPGKCLSVDATTGSWAAVAAATRSAALCGSAPSARPKMNDAESAGTSATVPKLTWIPERATSAARAANAADVAATGCVFSDVDAG